jgi:Zn-finger nucleic acid-binding protein
VVCSSCLAGLWGDESEAESEIEKGREVQLGERKQGDESEEVREREDGDEIVGKKKKKSF